MKTVIIVYLQGTRLEYDIKDKPFSRVKYELEETDQLKFKNGYSEVIINKSQCPVIEYYEVREG